MGVDVDVVCEANGERGEGGGYTGYDILNYTNTLVYIHIHIHTHIDVYTYVPLGGGLSRRGGYGRPAPWTGAAPRLFIVGVSWVKG